MRRCLVGTCLLLVRSCGRDARVVGGGAFPLARARSRSVGRSHGRANRARANFERSQASCTPLQRLRRQPGRGASRQTPAPGNGRGRGAKGGACAMGGSWVGGAGGWRWGWLGTATGRGLNGTVGSGGTDDAWGGGVSARPAVRRAPTPRCASSEQRASGGEGERAPRPAPAGPLAPEGLGVAWAGGGSVDR